MFYRLCYRAHNHKWPVNSWDKLSHSASILACIGTYFPWSVHRMWMRRIRHMYRGPNMINTLKSRNRICIRRRLKSILERMSICCFCLGLGWNGFGWYMMCNWITIRMKDSPKWLRSMGDKSCLSCKDLAYTHRDYLWAQSLHLHHTWCNDHCRYSRHILHSADCNRRKTFWPMKSHTLFHTACIRQKFLPLTSTKRSGLCSDCRVRMLFHFSGSIIPCNHTCWFRSFIWSVCCRRRFYSRRRWSIIYSLKLRYSSGMKVCRQICKFLECSCKCRGLELEWNLLMDHIRYRSFMFGTLHTQEQRIRRISHRIRCILSCICIRRLL